MRPRREDVPRAWHVALLYVALTVALAYPLARHAAGHVLSVGPDTDLFLWTLSWDAHAFVHQPLSLFDANIFAPLHRTLGFSEPLIGSAFFAAPILWLTDNPVLAMNAVALLSCVLCGVGTYVLARRVGIGPAGAALSGLIFAFAPPRFLRLDQLFLTTIQWVPFGLAYLHAYLDNDDGGDPFDLRMAAAFFTLQTLTSGHGAVFLALASAALLGYRVVMGAPLALEKRVRDLGAVGLLLLAPIVPIVLVYARVQAEMGLKRSLADWLITTPESFLASPTYVHSFLLTRLFPDAHINQNANAYLFPGYLPLLLAAIGLFSVAPSTSSWRRPPNMWTRAALAADVVMVASAAIAVLIAITGPVRLTWGTAMIFSARDPWRALLAAAVSAAIRIAILRRAPFKAMPRVAVLASIARRWLAARREAETTFYALLVLLCICLAMGPPLGLWPLVYWLPGFNFIRAASRFMLLAVLGLSVIAGSGFECATVRLPASARLVAAAIVAALLVAEFAVPLGVRPYRVVVPSADRWLAGRPAPFTVAEVPLPELARVFEFEKRQSEYMLHSTVHWQKTVHGWSGLQPPDHLALYDRLMRFPDEDSLRSLAAFRVDYVVVHSDLYAPAEWVQVERRLAAYQERLELRYGDDTGRVYALRPPQARR
jgi:hypothetical protein